MKVLTANSNRIATCLLQQSITHLAPYTWVSSCKLTVIFTIMSSKYHSCWRRSVSHLDISKSVPSLDLALGLLRLYFSQEGGGWSRQARNFPITSRTYFWYLVPWDSPSKGSEIPGFARSSSPRSCIQSTQTWCYACPYAWVWTGLEFACWGVQSNVQRGFSQCGTKPCVEKRKVELCRAREF